MPYLSRSGVNMSPTVYIKLPLLVCSSIYSLMSLSDNKDNWHRPPLCIGFGLALSYCEQWSSSQLNYSSFSLRLTLPALRSRLQNGVRGVSHFQVVSGSLQKVLHRRVTNGAIVKSN